MGARGEGQIRKVQRSSCRECRCRFGMTAVLGTRVLRTCRVAYASGAGRATVGWRAGATSWIPRRTGGAKFTGASDSLKAVSGASARGTAAAQTVAPKRTRIKIQRIRATLLNPGLRKYSGLGCLSMAQSARVLAVLGSFKTRSRTPEGVPRTNRLYRRRRKGMQSRRSLGQHVSEAADLGSDGFEFLFDFLVAAVEVVDAVDDGLAVGY